MPHVDPALSHFADAQASVIGQVEAELAAGRKRTHWMWFIFPQLSGLGMSPTSRKFGLADLDEARRYLADPVLGERLRRHVRLMLQCPDGSAHSILGSPDDLKFRSCLTLFHAAATEPDDMRLFEQGLSRFYEGKPDPATLSLLRLR